MLRTENMTFSTKFCYSSRSLAAGWIQYIVQRAIAGHIHWNWNCWQHVSISRGCHWSRASFVERISRKEKVWDWSRCCSNYFNFFWTTATRCSVNYFSHDSFRLNFTRNKMFMYFPLPLGIWWHLRRGFWMLFAEFLFLHMYIHWKKKLEVNLWVTSVAGCIPPPTFTKV